ncbi:PspC domain-containing protein [Rhodococcus gannanensis]|uniref:PspC domain-containing protein n=1 Tax=Rhodococcus gannanensis TaxID=1960308 RepID=A0ABW4P341_9NOCA
MSTATFSEQLNQLWRTRPVRLPRRGPIAGVAAGVGRRYDVDPVLIRIAFVVSTIFGGAGIVLYLAGWLLLPRAGDDTSAAESLLGRGHSSESGTKTIVLVVALMIALSTLGPLGVSFGGSGVFSLALMLGGLWLLFQRRPYPPASLPDSDPWAGISVPPPGFPQATGFPSGYDTSAYTSSGVFATLPKTYEPSPSSAATATPGAASGTTAESASSTPTAPTSAGEDQSGPTAPDPAPPTDVTAPPAWDPLGVAPFAWDLPEPAPAPTLPAPRPERPKSRLTSVVLGLAILATAAAWALAAATGWEWLTPGRIGAVGLAVIGVGLVAGAFLRRGYGLLVVTGPLTGFVILASLVGPIDWESGTVGTRTWTPATAADIQPEYTGRFGEFTLDLSALELTEDKTVDVDLRMGSFTVLVPENMNVVNHCSMTVGDAQCLPEGLTGGADGTDGPVLTLNMNGRMGNLEVHRG